MAYEGMAWTLRALGRYEEAAAAVRVLLDEPRERRVLQLRFGLEDGRSRTLEEVGRDAARSTDILIGVGPLARTAVEAARRAGLAEAHSAQDRGEALVLLRRLQRPGDTILVKGSNSLALYQLADALVRPVAV